jgi:hypothetical protein
VATPAGIVLGWLAPRPLDLLVAPPLVLFDIWMGPPPRGPAADHAALGRSLALFLGIGLTWLWYIVVARLLLWRLVGTAPPAGGTRQDREPSG